MKINFIAVMLITAASLLNSKNSLAQGFKLTFYSDFKNDPTVKFCDGCILDNIGYNAVINTNYNMRDYPYSKHQDLGNLNDRFKSVGFDATGGMTITFFNNSDADYSGGSCIVYVKKNVIGYRLNSFEATYEDEWIKVQYWSEQQSLNGKISCFRVSK